MIVIISIITLNSYHYCQVIMDVLLPHLLRQCQGVARLLLLVAGADGGAVLRGAFGRKQRLFLKKGGLLVKQVETSELNIGQGGNIRVQTPLLVRPHSKMQTPL